MVFADRDEAGRRLAARLGHLRGEPGVVLAVPVAPRGWQAAIGGNADELACVETPTVFFAIGQHYASFPPVSDDEVLDCLQRAAAARQAAQAGRPSAVGNVGPSVIRLFAPGPRARTRRAGT